MAISLGNNNRNKKNKLPPPITSHLPEIFLNQEQKTSNISHLILKSWGQERNLKKPKKS